MEIKEILLIGVAFLNVTLGFIIFWDNKKNWANIFFGLLATSLSFWSLGMFMYVRSVFDYQNIILWSKILYTAGVSVPVFFVLFSYAFPDGDIKLVKKKIIAGYFFIYIILTSIVLCSSEVIESLVVKNGQRILVHGKLYPLYFVFFFLGMLWALYILFNKYRHVSGNLKVQLKIMLWGTSIPIIFAGFVNMILPLLHNFYYSWTGPFSSLVLISFISYGIIKNRLMNARLIATEIFSVGITLFTLVQFLGATSIEETFVRLIIFVFTLIFSILLIRSVLKEVKRREEIEILAGKLAQANEKMKKINKQLQSANAELKQLDDAKSEFISIASHQLRTPLTAVKGYGSMLLDGDFGEITNEKQRNAINIMFISGNRLINLVENLLNISRIESGRMQFKFEAKSLADLARESCDTLRNSAASQKLYLKFIEPKKPLPLAVIDDEKIRQVLQNFVDNAIKYTKEGGITVLLEQGKDEIICRVQDTGMGVTPEDQQKLFKKFSRGKDAFLVNTEGNGLGLYVAHMMIDAHKGRIWIESEGIEGKGSKFCFSLPTAESAAGKKLMEESKKEQARMAKEREKVKIKK